MIPAPLELAVSYNYFTKNNAKSNRCDDFHDWVQKGIFCINYHMYTDPHQGNSIVDRVIRYQNLNSELNDVFNYLAIPFYVSLKIRAKGNYGKDRLTYSDFFSTSEAYRRYTAITSKVFEKEIQLHGYNVGA